jgi:type VI secretion system VasI family protein
LNERDRIMRQLFHHRRTAALIAALLLSIMFYSAAARAQVGPVDPNAAAADDEDKKDAEETKKAPPHDNRVAPNAAVDFPTARAHVSQCEQLDDAVLRLQCFDRLATDLGFAQEQKAEQQLAKYGFWAATSKLNGMGERLTNMRLPPTTPYITATGVVRIPELILSCRVNFTEAYIDWKATLATSKKIDVVYNFDNDPNISARWDLSDDGEAMFIPHGLDFIRSLNGRKALTIQMTPAGESLAILNFNLDGLQNVLNLMYERCYK